MNTQYIFVALAGTYIYQNDNGKQMPIAQVMTLRSLRVSKTRASSLEEE